MCMMLARGALMRLIALGLATGASVASPVIGATPGAGPPRLAITHHEIPINGDVVRYTAAVREIRVADPAGRIGASVITIAYTRDTAAGTNRPVIFAFNGGPGASSSPLHMKALGPIIRTRAGPDDTSGSRLMENTVSVLDTADLVFIDPVSTGFSRPFLGVDPKPWYDSRFDAETVAAVIGAWLRVNHREASPRFLMGESYGTIRAGLILARVPKLRFDGVLLVSGPGVPMDAPADVRIISSIASMAAGAWYHRKVDRRGLSSADFFREAMAFARGPLARALARSKDLPEADKHRVAVQLAGFIGLPVDLILAHDLRIDANTYMFNLLKDQGLRTGRLDLRVTGPLLPGQEGAIDDPALGVVKPGARSGPAPTPASVGAVESPIVGRYLVRQLHFASNVPYIGVNFLANSQWTFHSDPDTEANMAAAMARDRGLRLFVTAGYFDFGAGDGSRFLDAGVPAQRFVFVPLPGPHEVYDGDENRKAFNEAVRRFVSSG